MSAVAWIAFLEKRRIGFLILSVGSYAIALGTYEMSFAIPLAFVALLNRQCWKRDLRWLTPFAILALFYVVWRLTNAFGAGHSILYAPVHFDIEMSLWTLRFNLMRLLGSWIGVQMLQAIVWGVHGFKLWNAGLIYTLLAIDIVVTVMLLFFAAYFCQENRKQGDPGRRQSRSISVPLFAVIWVLAAYLPFIVWPVRGRHHFLPVVGIALFAGFLLRKFDKKAMYPLYGFCILLCLIVNQGTARSWELSGKLNRELFQHIETHAEALKEKKLIVIDTSSIRSALSGVNFTERKFEQQGWANFLNAGLLRGFALRSMLTLSMNGKPASEVLLDMEHGTRIVENNLVWHEKYNPLKSYRTCLRSVYIIKCSLIPSVEIEGQAGATVASAQSD